MPPNPSITFRKTGLNLTHEPGISLLEVSLMIVLLTLVMVPYTLMMTQTAQNTRGVFIAATRGLLLNRLGDEMNPERPTFVTDFSQASSMNTTITELGQTIPFRRYIDTTTANASDTLNKQVYLYLYTNSTDSSSAPLYKTTLLISASQYRTRVGNTSGLTDSSNNFWFGDSSLYTAANKQPGYVSNMGTTGSTGSNIVNANDTYDDTLYQNYRIGTSNTNLDYNFDLISGSYTVKLYFCETNASVTGTAPNRRLMDIYLEGALRNATAYSPYETTGGAYRANVVTYDVDVSDGTLNVSVRKNSSSNNDAILSGITIQKRVMK